MSVRRRVVKLPHLGLDYELCAHGYGNLNDPLQVLLAVEEQGELTFPSQAVEVTITTWYPSVLDNRTLGMRELPRLAKRAIRYSQSPNINPLQQEGYRVVAEARIRQLRALGAHAIAEEMQARLAPQHLEDDGFEELCEPDYFEGFLFNGQPLERGEESKQG